MFLSAFSNANGFGLTQELGATVLDKTYMVSFSIASYGNNPVQISDFATLNIGAQGGTTTWSSTPAISESDTWFLWTGEYTPTGGKVGQPFVFEFQFGPTGTFDFAIDGPISATAVSPSAEPAGQWAPQTSGTTEILVDVHFTDDNNGWAIGSSGIILNTSDGGANWAAQTFGTTVTPYALHFTDINHGWVVGESGSILNTSDGGVNWAAQTGCV